MARRIFVAILVSVAMTVGVAWICALSPARFRRGAHALSAAHPPAWFVWSLHAPAMHVVISELMTDPNMIRRQLLGGVVVQRGRSIPRWSRAARVDAAWASGGGASRADAWSLMTETASGWPWPALRAAYGAPHGSKSLPTFERGIFIPVLCTHFGQELERGVLPTAPIWPGFLGNTAVYAMVIFPIISARHWRRQHRVRRGLCAKCAYPVSGMEKCPECGTSVSKGTVVATRA